MFEAEYNIDPHEFPSRTALFLLARVNVYTYTAAAALNLPTHNAMHALALGADARSLLFTYCFSARRA